MSAENLRYLVADTAPSILGSDSRKVAIKTARMRIGSAPENDLVIADSSISRQHAVITHQSTDYLLADLHSTNGTYINGRRVKEPVLIQAGDRIEFGSARFDFVGLRGTGHPGAGRWRKPVFASAMLLVLAVAAAFITGAIKDWGLIKAPVPAPVAPPVSANTAPKAAAALALKNCLACAIALDSAWASGKSFTPFNAGNHTLVKNGSGTVRSSADDLSASQITTVLQHRYGGAKAKYAFINGLEGYQAQREGRPVTTSQSAIVDALVTAGPGSRGLVFVDGGHGTPGYVFNARNVAGRIEFRDPQNGAEYLTFGGDSATRGVEGATSRTNSRWQRVWFYRTG